MPGMQVRLLESTPAPKGDKSQMRLASSTPLVGDNQPYPHGALCECTLCKVGQAQKNTIRLASTGTAHATVPHLLSCQTQEAQIA